MNCRRFQHDLYEYLDGTLSPQAQAAAEKHLSECALCRQRLGQEQQVARSLSGSFRRATEPLQLPPGIERRVLAALAEERRGAGEKPVQVFFWRRLAWPLALAVSVLLLLACGLFLLRGPGPGGIRPQPYLAGGGIWIQLSYVVPSYTFRQEGGFVIDALSYHTNEVNERLWTDPARRP